MGNLYSIANACDKVGLDVVITNDPKKIEAAAAIILPGVGAYPLAVQQLQQHQLSESIINFVQSGKYTLGICLGMQLLMDQSEEFGVHKGLEIIKGEVQRFPKEHPSSKVRFVPQINWNKVKIEMPSHPLFKNIGDEEYFFFVHSNYVHPRNKEAILCTTTYVDFEYCSAIAQQNVFGIQFHPEKSGPQGLKIIKNFRDLIKL